MFRFRRPPARNHWLQQLRGCGVTLPGDQERWPESACLSLLLALPAKQAPSRINVTRRSGYNCFPAVILTTGTWMKGGSPRMLVDAFGMPDVFC